MDNNSELFVALSSLLVGGRACFAWLLAWLMGCLVAWLLGCLVAWLLCLLARLLAWLLGCLTHGTEQHGHGQRSSEGIIRGEPQRTNAHNAPTIASFSSSVAGPATH